MQETLHQTADAGVSLTADAGVFPPDRCRLLHAVSLSDSGCRSLSIRQRMQESLYQTADAGVSSIRQRIQEALYQSDAGVSPACRSLSDRDAGVSLCIRCLIERISIRQLQEYPDRGDQQSGCRRLLLSLYQTADAEETI